MLDRNSFNCNYLRPTEFNRVQQAPESGSGPGGRRFKSSLPDQLFNNSKQSQELQDRPPSFCSECSSVLSRVNTAFVTSRRVKGPATKSTTSAETDALSISKLLNYSRITQELSLQPFLRKPLSLAGSLPSSRRATLNYKVSRSPFLDGTLPTIREKSSPPFTSVSKKRTRP